MERTTQSGCALEIVMVVPHSHRRELLQTLEGLKETFNNEGRVKDCELLEDRLVPNRFYWVERWQNDEDVEAALASDRVATLMAAIHLLGDVESVRQVHTRETLGLPPENSK